MVGFCAAHGTITFPQWILRWVGGFIACHLQLFISQLIVAALFSSNTTENDSLTKKKKKRQKKCFYWKFVVGTKTSSFDNGRQCSVTVAVIYHSSNSKQLLSLRYNELCWIRSVHRFQGILHSYCGCWTLKTRLLYRAVIAEHDTWLELERAAQDQTRWRGVADDLCSTRRERV